MNILHFLCLTSIVFGDSSTTLQQPAKPDLCSLPADQGSCRAHFIRFAYNQTSGHCEEFVYGGCRGNANNFHLQETCEATCEESQADNMDYSKECPKNSKFVTCGTACPLTCDNFQNPPTECNRMCYVGCECNEGYVRAENGSCILPENCSLSFLRNLSPVDCPLNSHFNPCGTDCPMTCENYQDPPEICNFMCRIGCECDDGYVLTRGGSCILPENCALQNCPANSAFTSCGTSCPRTCENYLNTPEFCMSMCKIGCECQAGFVLTEDGRCVLPVDCPVTTCPPHAQFNSCGTYCPLTCQNYQTPPEVCILMCNPGCECEVGYVLEEDGSCVLPESCANDNTTDICRQPAKPGPCRELSPRFYYNQRNKRCQQFYYGGCQGNDNNFLSLEDCNSACLASHLPFACQQSKEVGACEQNFSRFFYNKTIGQCEEFIYKGCEGNDNNFQSLEDCSAVCKTEQVESNMI